MKVSLYLLPLLSRRKVTLWPRLIIRQIFLKSSISLIP